MVQTAESDFKTEFAVEMTCESCVSDVKNVLEGAEGIKKYDINLKEQRVVVEGSAPPSAISRLLKNTGKTVIVRGSGVAQGSHAGAAVCILDINSDDPSYTTLPGTEKPYGLVRFLQVNTETCVVDVTVQGLTPGNHGIHIHELGDTSGGSATTGPHFNPTNTTHGDDLTGHVGDLGNIEVDEKGWGDLVLESKRIKVWDIIGRSMVVTEKADNLGKGSCEASKEDGASGKGIICGIIARSAGVFENAKKVCDCSGTTLWEEARIMGGEKGNDFY
ncbi:MAG: superoxide dismutase [Linnemannia elongata]|nr:MAG: superoxide dismutase [Linnemannia elongata]